jgi:putative DNA methylase
MMTGRKKLIEVALPLEQINAAAVHEKAVRVGHPNNVHFWWARRPLAACRAVLFASLVDDPSSLPERFPTEEDQERERRRLFNVIDRLVRWENTADEEVLAEARTEIRRSVGADLPPLLDPFCGGGAIPLEGQRLGLQTFASDLNPVAVLITKALTEIPTAFSGSAPVHPDARASALPEAAWRGAAGLAEDVGRYGSWVRDEAEKQIGYLYPRVKVGDATNEDAVVVAWLWARTVTCPNPACRAVMPLVRSFWLSTKADRQARVVPVVDPGARAVRFEISHGQGPGPEGTVGRTGARCLVCSVDVPLAYVRQEGQAGRMGTQLLAIVAEGARGRRYLPPDGLQEALARSPVPSWAPDTDLPDEALGFRVQNYGFKSHRDLYTSRQLTALATLAELTSDARARVYVDAVSAGMKPGAPTDGDISAQAYADAVTTYLALAVSGTVARCNAFVTWMLSVECPGHLFSRSALSMAWDFAEANVISGPSGSYLNMVNGVAAGIAAGAAISPLAPGRATQQDAQDLTAATPRYLISFDPPYYDNVPYADLSDIYYVWLRHMLAGLYPSLFRTLLTPKANELVADPIRFGSRDAAARHFESGLRRAFARIRECAAPDYPITVYYAFKQAEETDNTAESRAASTGWETMLEGLVGAGLTITGTWPIRTERQARARALSSNALASSIVLVCRRRAVSGATSSRPDRCRARYARAGRTMTSRGPGGNASRWLPDPTWPRRGAR